MSSFIFTPETAHILYKSLELVIGMCDVTDYKNYNETNAA